MFHSYRTTSRNVGRLIIIGGSLDPYYGKIRDDLVRLARTNSEEHIDPEAIEKDSSRRRGYRVCCGLYSSTVHYLCYGLFY